MDFDAAFRQSVPDIASNNIVYSSNGSDQAQWLFFDPVEYSTDLSDTLYAVFSNSGDSLWTEEYCLEYYAGFNPSKSDQICLNESVQPNGQGTFAIPIQSNDANWRGCWQLKNAAGESFYEFCYNHGNGTNSTAPGTQSAQNDSSDPNLINGVYWAFVKTAGSAPAKYSSSELSAEFLSTSPSDKHTFCAYDHSENLTVSIKNNGTETWDTSYSLVFYSGYNWMHSNSFSLPGTVESGETAVFTLPMEIFEDNDKWVTCWYLSSPEGLNLADFCFNYYTRGC